MRTGTNLSSAKLTTLPQLSSILTTAPLRRLFLSLILMFLNCLTTQTLASNLPSKTIGISQIVEHPALNEVREGLMNSLKSHGFEENKNLTVLYENAQGNMGTSIQIASKLLSASPDVMVAISTSSAQTLLHAAKRSGSTIPIVFTAVSDPISAELVPGPTAYPITGVSDAPHLEGLLELMDNLMPKLKTLGLLYNASETNSVSTIKKLKKLLAARGIRVYEVTVNSTGEVAQATASFVGKVDALYFPQDNTVVSALETVIKVAQGASLELAVILPIFCSDPVLIKKGVLAAVGYDYKDIGHETGDMIAKILEGGDALKMPIHHPKQLKSIINQTLAKKLGLNIPTRLKHSSLQIVE